MLLNCISKSIILILNTIMTSQVNKIENAKITKNHNYFLPFS